MFRIVKTEIWKLKRYHMIWAGVFLMLLSVLLTLFSTTALDGTYWTFSHFTEQVIKNNFSMIFPMCNTLLGGYIIVREERDDTMKSILTVPVSVYCGHADYCSDCPYLGRTYDWDNPCICLWIWGNVCRREYDACRHLPNHGKPGVDPLPKL